MKLMLCILLCCFNEYEINDVLNLLEIESECDIIVKEVIVVSDLLYNEY